MKLYYCTSRYNAAPIMRDGFRANSSGWEDEEGNHLRFVHLRDTPDWGIGDVAIEIEIPDALASEYRACYKEPEAPEWVFPESVDINQFPRRILEWRDLAPYVGP
jgi:hypothetical protein